VAPPSAPRHRDLDLPPGTRRILHLDVDAFLASVEQALHPELAGRPVIVGGMPDERNLVMACSYEARAFGVRSGMRLAEAARRCPEAVFRRGDSQAANRLREGVARILLGFSPRVEVSSIDDFFVDLTGTTRLAGAACDAAVRMREAIREEVRLPVTVGIGTNRTLARLAGKLGKPGGVAEILPGCEEAFLAHLPVRELPGVGHSIGRLLERFSIRTVGELRLVSREVLWASFGRPGLLLHERARGIDPEPVEATRVEGPDGELVARAPRSIQRDSTFEPEEGRREIVEAMLSYVVERAADALRRHRLVASSLEVRLVYVDARTPAQRRAQPDRRPSYARRRTLSAPCDATDELWRRARAMLRELPRRRALVKRVGVALTRLAPADGWQGRLFSEEVGSDAHGRSRADRQRILDRVLDGLRERHGFGRLIRGSSFPLVRTHPLGADGFRLRTPSLNQ